MIIWLASYPKSGNTWVRSFLTNLLYSNDESIDLNDSGILTAEESDTTGDEDQSDGDDNKNNDSNSTTALIIIKDPLTEILVLSFLFICQIIISFYVTQYYLLLPSKQERNRIEHTLRI